MGSFGLRPFLEWEQRKKRLTSESRKIDRPSCLKAASGAPVLAALDTTTMIRTVPGEIPFTPH
jgi:hypothetical protein